VLLVSARNAREQCIHYQVPTPPPQRVPHCACLEAPKGLMRGAASSALLGREASHPGITEGVFPADV
jgi:hypothetical protein